METRELMQDTSFSSWVEKPHEHIAGYYPESIVQDISSASPVLVLAGDYTDPGSGSGSFIQELTQACQQIPVSAGVEWDVYKIVFHAVPEDRDLPSVSEKIKFIKEVFGLSVAALASILNASRASVYNWLDNEYPSDYFVQRIDRLLGIVKEWKKIEKYDFPPGRLMKQRLGEGSSLLDRLSTEELNLSEIQQGMHELIVLMGKRNERMEKSKARTIKQPGDTESQEEIIERVTGSVTSYW